MNEPTNKKGKWTTAEDKLVLDKIGEMKSLNSSFSYSKISFSAVANSVSGRSSKQVQERWENVLRPGLKKGAWSEEETLKLLQSIKDYGQEWYSIQRDFPNRAFHSIKVKGRWLLGEVASRQKHVNQPTIRISQQWSNVEISQLKMLHQSYSYDFHVIAEQLPFKRPLAQIERNLYEVCFCVKCVEIKAEVYSLAEKFKNGWSKFKANEILAQKMSVKRRIELRKDSENFRKASIQDKIRPMILNYPQNAESEHSLLQRQNSSSSTNCSSTSLQTQDSETKVRKFLEMILTLTSILGFDTMKRTFFMYMTKPEILTLLQSCETNSRLSLTNPCLPYLIKYKLDTTRDKRYFQQFLFPAVNKFDEAKPVGTLAIENINLIILDTDVQGKNLLGENLIRKHYLNLFSSRLNGFYLFCNLYKYLIEAKNKEVWCHSLFRKSNGKAGVFLTHVQYGFYSETVCRQRIQDVSDQFKDIVSLPPEL